MTVVNLIPLVDEWGGAEPATVKVTATAMKARARAVRVSGPDVLLAVALESTVTGGVADPPLDLPPIPIDCYWQIDVAWTATGSVKPFTLTRYVAGPTGPTVDFGDLVDVNPVTALATPGTALADAYLAQLDAIRAAVLAADDGITQASTAAVEAAAAAEQSAVAVLGIQDDVNAAAVAVAADAGHVAEDKAEVTALVAAVALPTYEVTLRPDGYSVLTISTSPIGV